MSKLAEFRALELKLAQQLQELEALKNDKNLKKEIEFEEKLNALMSEYGVSLRQVVNILDPEASLSVTASAKGGNRRERQLKVYKNPKSGEIVETKGGNHKVLKAWKEEFGAEEVESWRQQ